MKLAEVKTVTEAPFKCQMFFKKEHLTIQQKFLLQKVDENIKLICFIKLTASE